MATFQYVLIFTAILASLSFNPVQGSSCERAQNEYINQWDDREAKGKALLKTGELTYEDVKDLFSPKCEANGYYATRQCFMNTYCWCSDRNGDLLSGTFQKGKEADLDCSKS